MESTKEVVQGKYNQNLPLSFHKYGQNLVKMTIFYIATSYLFKMTKKYFKTTTLQHNGQQV